MKHWPWDALGIDPTRDEGTVRKAYADALRRLDLDTQVREYADLRRARDEGLWLARNEEDQDEGDFGLGSLDDPADDDLGFDVTSVRFTETGNTTGAQDGGLDWSQLNPADAGAGTFDALPLEDAPEEAPAPELDEGQERARTAWNGLLDILYPGGEYSDEAITLEQLGEGNRHLETLIRRSDECEIDEHHALDHGLAQLMAETWPRSAPFVETAADAFHWLDESGQIEERPALMFLNLRLRGMRFHEKVQQADHPLNKAWVELSKPGKARWIDRMRVKNSDVYQLLAGIRERYPEVESYLDWERIASWEHPEDNSGAGFPWWVGIIIVVVVARMAGSFVDDDRSTPPPVRISDMQVEEGAGDSYRAEYDARLEALFGEGVTMVEIRAADPIFATQLDNAMTRDRFGSTTIEDFVRSQASRAGTVARFDELVALAQLKRLWMMNALGSAEQCQRVMAGDFSGEPLQLDKAGMLAEAQLLKQLLDAGALSNLEGREAGAFSVPGWAVEEVIRRSALGADNVGAALRDPQHSSRCLVELTLLSVVIEQPGRVSEDLLRGL